MGIPWGRIFDTVIGAADVARRVTGGRAAFDDRSDDRLAVGTGAIGQLETRLAGVVVAALKEAFDRDSRRLELERQQVEAERQRAERALRLELIRQAGDREIGRLRLIAAVSVISWIGTLFFSVRMIGSGPGARFALGGGWLLLLLALALSFVAQARVAERMTRFEELSTSAAIDGGAAGRLAPVLIVAGLALVALAVLLL